MLVQIYDETSAKTGLEIKLFFDFVMVIGSACLLILYIKSPIVFVVECGEVIDNWKRSSIFVERVCLYDVFLFRSSSNYVSIKSRGLIKKRRAT